MTEEKLQAIYNTARAMFYNSVDQNDSNPIVSSSNVTAELQSKGYQITDQEVREGFKFLEHSDFVMLGNSSSTGNSGGNLFIIEILIQKFP